MGSSGPGRSSRVINGLVDAGVIELVDDGDELRMTDEFTAQLEECRATLTALGDAELREELTNATGDEDEAAALVEVSDTSEDILVDYLALSRVDPDLLSHADRLRALTVFDMLRPEPPPDDGVPEPFVPVHGHRLPFLVEMYPRAVVYTWLHDCPPCDLMKESFEKLIPEPPDDLALLAVYGPDCSRLLQERYDVAAGPTTLFFFDGDVDLRLYGPQHEQLLENELEKIRNIG